MEGGVGQTGQLLGRRQLPLEVALLPAPRHRRRRRVAAGDDDGAVLRRVRVRQRVAGRGRRARGYDGCRRDILQIHPVRVGL